VIRHKGAAFVEVFQAIVELKLIGVKRITQACMTSNVAIGEKSRSCRSGGVVGAHDAQALRTYSSQRVIGKIKDRLAEQFAAPHPSTSSTARLPLETKQ